MEEATLVYIGSGILFLLALTFIGICIYRNRQYIRKASGRN